MDRNIISTAAWTAEDERNFQALSARRGSIINERRARVVAVATAIHNQGFGSAEELADKLISHADELNDALTPYDSGLRVGAAHG